MGQQCIVTITTEGQEMKVDIKGDMAPLAAMQGLIEAMKEMTNKAVVTLTDKEPRYKDGKYTGG